MLIKENGVFNTWAQIIWAVHWELGWDFSPDMSFPPFIEADIWLWTLSLSDYSQQVSSWWALMAKKLSSKSWLPSLNLLPAMNSLGVPWTPFQFPSCNLGIKLLTLQRCNVCILEQQSRHYYRNIGVQHRSSKWTFSIRSARWELLYSYLKDAHFTFPMFNSACCLDHVTGPPIAMLLLLWYSTILRDELGICYMATKETFIPMNLRDCTAHLWVCYGSCLKPYR